MIILPDLIKNIGITSENDKAFLNRIFKDGIEIYVERLKQYEFAGYEKVLDSGCGFGQWSLALSSLNKEVYSCDADPIRLKFLNDLSSSLGVTNLHTSHNLIQNLPFEDAYFDAIFCYGVLFITPWEESLLELVRVLKPGGKLYVNANGLGWYKHLWYSNHNKTSDYDPRKIASEAWLNTYRYNEGLDVDFPQQLIIEPLELMKKIQSLGFKSIFWDGDGMLGNPLNKNVFFQKEYFGDIGVYEVIAIKR